MIQWDQAGEKRKVEEVWGSTVIIINIRFIYENYKIKDLVVSGE